MAKALKRADKLSVERAKRSFVRSSQFVSRLVRPAKTNSGCQLPDFLSI